MSAPRRAVEREVGKCAKVGLVRWGRRREGEVSARMEVRVAERLKEEEGIMMDWCASASASEGV